MDKYQEQLVNERTLGFLGFDDSVKTLNDSVLDRKSMKLTIKQKADITITKYLVAMVVCDNSPIEKVLYKIGDHWEEKKSQLPKGTLDKYGINDGNLAKEESYPITFDFDNRIEEIKLVFKNGLADDLVIPVVYLEASKDAYYQKIQEQNRAQLEEKASVIVKTGIDLINVFFQPVSKQFSYAVVELFLVNSSTSKQTVGEFKPNDKQFFVSICGLAKAEFGIILKEFDKDDHIIFESHLISASVLGLTFPSVIRCNGGRY